MIYPEIKKYVLEYTSRNKAEWGKRTILYTSNDVYAVVDELKKWQKKDTRGITALRVVFTGSPGTAEPPGIVTEYRGENF